MIALQDVPPPHPAVTIALLGLVGVLWLALRINLLRRREAVRPSDDPPVPARGWMRRLAGWPGTYPLLALLAAGFAGLLVYGWSA